MLIFKEFFKTQSDQNIYHVHHNVYILGVEVVSLIQNILAIDWSLTYSRISILPGKTYKLL